MMRGEYLSLRVALSLEKGVVEFASFGRCAKGARVLIRETTRVTGVLLVELYVS